MANLKTFLSLTHEFIEFQRQQEKEVPYTETDDLSVLYRYIAKLSYRSDSEFVKYLGKKY